MRRAGAVCVLAALVGACAPFYRDDELRARRAADPAAIAPIVERAEALSKDGKHDDAAEKYKEAISVNPDSAELFLALANEELAANRYSEARAAATFGLGRTAKSDGVQSSLKAKIAEAWGEEQLYQRALESLDPSIDASGERFMLHGAFDKLATASKEATAKHAASALAAYEAWRDAYGVPDHPRVRAWSDAVLEAYPDRGNERAREGDRAAAAGDLAGAAEAYAGAHRLMSGGRFNMLVRAKAVDAAKRARPGATRAAEEHAARSADMSEKGHIGEAIHAARLAVDESPFVPELRHNLAVLLAAVDLREDATAQMDWFLELAPDSPAAATARARRAEWAARPDPGSDATPAPRSDGKAVRTVAIVAMASGAAALAAGTAFAVVARMRQDDARGCAADTCDTARGDAQTYGNVATAVLAAGGGVLLGGLVTWWLAPHPPEGAPTVGVRVDGTGASLIGRF